MIPLHIMSGRHPMAASQHHHRVPVVPPPDDPSDGRYQRDRVMGPTPSEHSSASSPTGDNDYNAAGPSAHSPTSTRPKTNKRPRPYASKTCSECRRRKIACVPSDPDPLKCRRCFKMQLNCTLAEEIARGDKKRRRRKAGSDQAASHKEDGGDGDDDEYDDDGHEEELQHHAVSGQPSHYAPPAMPASYPPVDMRHPGSSPSLSLFPTSQRTPPAFSRSLSLSAPSNRHARPQIRSSIAAPGPSAVSPTSAGVQRTARPPPPPPPPAPSATGIHPPSGKRKADQGPDTDFIYSIKEDQDLPTANSGVQIAGRARRTASNASQDRPGQPVAFDVSARVGIPAQDSVGTQSSTRPPAAGPSAPTSSSVQAQRAMVKAAEDAMSAQSAMLVHGCPVWVYSDLMARFRLLEGVFSSKTKSVSAKVSVAALNAKLADIATEAIDAMDGILEESRLTMPHLPLLRNLIARQEQQHDPGRFLLATLLVYVASNGATPSHVPHLPRQLLMEIKSFLTHQALDCIMMSPTKSRELIIAIEVLAVYDPLLGHSMSTRPQTSWFVVPTSFYLELAVGYAYRLGLADSAKKVQDWCKTRREEDIDDDAPLPSDVASALLDATMWVSLELHSAELCRNLQSVTNCFAKDWKPMWPDAKGGVPFSQVVRLCTRHLTTASSTAAMTTTKRSFAGGNPTLGSKLGLVSMAFRHDGLLLVQEILSTLYDGIPSVEAIDSNYVRLEEDLSTRLKKYADVSHQRVMQSSKAGAHEADLITLSNSVLQRELAWMKHFYGGYCFAILLWLPKLAKKHPGAVEGQDAAGNVGGKAAMKTSEADLSAKVKKAAKLELAGEEAPIPSTTATTNPPSPSKDERRDSDSESVSRNIHEHGIHGSDIAKSVIDAIKSQHSHPDQMEGGGVAGEGAAPDEGITEAKTQGPSADGENIAAAGATDTMTSVAVSDQQPVPTNTSDKTAKAMTSFDFLMKHTPEHEAGVQRWLTLSLSTTSTLRSGNIHRIPTNSRTIYVCKEIIENHATRKRGWGKVGDEAVVHIGLFKQTCDHFKDGENVLDRSLAKLTKILEKILDGWRKVKAEGEDIKTADGKTAVSGQASATSAAATTTTTAATPAQTAAMPSPPSRLVGGQSKSHSRTLSSSNMRSTINGGEEGTQGFSSQEGAQRYGAPPQPQAMWQNGQQRYPFASQSTAPMQSQPPHSTYGGHNGYPQTAQQPPSVMPAGGYGSPSAHLPQQAYQSPHDWAMQQQQQQHAQAPRHYQQPNQYQQNLSPSGAPGQYSYPGTEAQGHALGPPPHAHEGHAAPGYFPGDQQPGPYHSGIPQDGGGSQLSAPSAPMGPTSINTPGSAASQSNFDLGLTNLLDMDIFSTDMEHDWSLGDYSGSGSATMGGGMGVDQQNTPGNALDVERLFMNLWPRLDWGLDASGVSGGATGTGNDLMMSAAADMGSELALAMSGGGQQEGDGNANGHWSTAGL